jgi:hypothetical protein
LIIPPLQVRHGDPRSTPPAAIGPKPRTRIPAPEAQDITILSRGLATVEPGVVCVHPQAWYEYIPIGARLCLPGVGLAWRLQHRPGQPGFGDDLQEALLHALLASRSQGRACFYCRLTDKYWFADQARVLSQEMELKLYATHGTAEALSGHRVHRARQAPRGRGDDGWMPSSRDSSTW